MNLSILCHAHCSFTAWVRAASISRQSALIVWHNAFNMLCRLPTCTYICTYVVCLCYVNFYLAATVYCISSKFHCPRNVAACFCQLVPLNAALKISPHGKGSTAIYVCTHASYTCIQIGLLLKLRMRMRIDLCRCCPRNLAALELSSHQTGSWNKILLWWNFEELWYTCI